MKKGVIITAVILMVIGLVIFVAALLFGESLKPAQMVETRYPVSEPFTDIVIKPHEVNIRFLPSTDGTCSVVCNLAQRAKKTAKIELSEQAVIDQTTLGGMRILVSVKEEKLWIESEDHRTWIDHLFSFGEQTVTVYLPKETYRNLKIESTTGDVELPNGFTFESVQIDGSTSASGAVGIHTTTGDITLLGAAAQSLDLSATTADVRIQNSSVKGDVSIALSTGKTEIEGLTCGSLTTTGSTGRVILNNTQVSGALFIKRSTGDVTFCDIDADSIKVENGTGDVTGTVRTEKVFFAQSKTGTVRVPQTMNGGKCEITVSTGDILIELSDGTNP